MDAINNFFNENFGDNSMGIILGVVAIIIIVIIGFFADRANKRRHKENNLNEDKSLSVEIKPANTDEIISEPQVTNNDQNMTETINNEVNYNDNNQDLSQPVVDETINNVSNQDNEEFEKTEVISNQPINPEQQQSKDEEIENLNDNIF